MRVVSHMMQEVGVFIVIISIIVCLQTDRGVVSQVEYTHSSGVSTAFCKHFMLLLLL